MATRNTYIPARRLRFRRHVRLLEGRGISHRIHQSLPTARSRTCRDAGYMLGRRRPPVRRVRRTGRRVLLPPIPPNLLDIPPSIGAERKGGARPSFRTPPLRAFRSWTRFLSGTPGARQRAMGRRPAAMTHAGDPALPRRAFKQTATSNLWPRPCRGGGVPQVRGRRRRRARSSITSVRDPQAGLRKVALGLESLSASRVVPEAARRRRGQRRSSRARLHAARVSWRRLSPCPPLHLDDRREARTRRGTKAPMAVVLTAVRRPSGFRRHAFITVRHERPAR